MFVTDIAIVLIIIYSGYVGTRRGFVLVGFELISFITATFFALVAYHAIGGWLSNAVAISLSLANISSFIVVWIVVETICALVVRLSVVPRLTAEVQFSPINQVGGAIGGGLRALILIALGLIVFADLPLPADAKQPVTGSTTAKLILSSTSKWQSLIANGLGHDLGASLTVFTVKADPESTERIALGFTTITVTPDPVDEAADLGLINHERTTRGLKALVANPKAQVVARAYATRMFADGVFSHIDNDGHNPFDRMRAGGVKFGDAGENLALAPTLQLAHQGLMNSPGHRANILSPDYRTVGIGIVNGGVYGLMVVQDFTD